MSEVKLVIRDAHHDLSGTRHGGSVDRAIAALSAEPETIDELERAIERFERPRDWTFFCGFRKGIDDEPYDAGLVIIDLAARLVAFESTYSSPALEGEVEFHDGHSATEHVLRYHLPDDWLFTRNIEGWRTLADDRRAERSANPPFDARAVLFGRPMLEFVAAESLAAFRVPLAPLPSAEPDTPLEIEFNPAGDDVESDDPFGGEAEEIAFDDCESRRDDREREIVRDIHVRWLLGPRGDLRGQAPREVLMARHGFIGWDLQDRQEQWSIMGACPRGLDPESHAFRFAGFGTHEIVKYYDLMRFLLWSCRDDVCELRSTPNFEQLTTGDFMATEVEHLEHLRDEYLDSPDSECHGMTPRAVIDHERSRLPEGMSPRDAIVDHDCPMCQMMGDMPGPMFWGLDGSHMDDDFAFDLSCQTREEWEAENRRRAEWNRRWEEQQAEQERLGVKYPGGGYADPDDAWERSFVARAGDEPPLAVRLFSIGATLAELIVDLKSPPEDRELIERLSRDFGNLRDVSQSDDPARAGALAGPVLDRFCETLDAVAVGRAALREKCSDLQSRLRRFLEPPREADPSEDAFGTDAYPDDEVPF